MPADKKITDLAPLGSLGLADKSVIVQGGQTYNFDLQALINLVQANVATGAGVSFGTIVPSGVTGTDGDIFINTATNYFYKKTAGTWVSVYQAPQSTGTELLFISGAPASSTGAEGDVTIDVTNGRYYQKESGVWVQKFSLLNGPSGPVGPQGPLGPVGPQGVQGPKGDTGSSTVYLYIYADSPGVGTNSSGQLVYQNNALLGKSNYLLEATQLNAKFSPINGNDVLYDANTGSFTILVPGFALVDDHCLVLWLSQQADAGDADAGLQGQLNNHEIRLVILETGQTGLQDQLGNKVDREAGKGLSTEDYTTTEKDKLSGIAPGAEVNVQPDWAQSNPTQDDFIKNKPAIPAKTSDLTNDSNFITLNDVPAGTFAADTTVSLSAGKLWLGRYPSGTTVPTAGKTYEQVLQMAAVEPISPTVGLSSGTAIKFNQMAVSNVLNLTYAINSLGATVTSVTLQWRRNNTGSWTTLSTNTGLTNYTHTLTDTAFNTQPFNYQYIVTDSAGGTATATLNITPGAYVAPSISIIQTAAALNGTQTNSSREKGNVSTNITATITQNAASSFVPLQSYQLQYQTNGGAWVDLNSSVSISGGTATITSTNHNDAALKSANALAYRVLVTDSYQTTTSSATGITFQYLYLFGYSSAGSLTSTTAYALGNGALSSTKARTINATPGAGNYLYILPPPGTGNLASVIQNGALNVLSAFNNGAGTPFGSTPVASLSVTNQYGVTATYSVNKSNQTNAWNGDTLAIL